MKCVEYIEAHKDDFKEVYIVSTLQTNKIDVFFCVN